VTPPKNLEILRGVQDDKKNFTEDAARELCSPGKPAHGTIDGAG